MMGRDGNACSQVLCHPTNQVQTLRLIDFVSVNKDKEIQRIICGRHTRNTEISSKEQPCHLPEETGVQLLCAASYDVWCRNLDTHQTTTEQTWGHTDQHGKKDLCSTSHTRTGSEREGQVIEIISNVRKFKWSGEDHINRLKDDRRTSRITTWRPYDKKMRQGRPAKQCRDDLDRYLRDMKIDLAEDITRQANLKAFAYPRDTTAG